MGSVPHVEMCKNAEYIEKVDFLPVKDVRSPLKVPHSKHGASGTCFEFGLFFIV